MNIYQSFQTLSYLGHTQTKSNEGSNTLSPL